MRSESLNWFMFYVYNESPFGSDHSHMQYKVQTLIDAQA